MSLLLDALKRAEQEKLARQAERTGEAGSERSIPAERAGGLALESLEAPRGAAGAAPPPVAAAPGERASAQALFAAKSESAKVASGTQRPLLIAGLVVAVLIVAGGSYAWLQITALGPKTYASRPAPSPGPGVKPIVAAASPETPVGMPTSAVRPPAGENRPAATTAPPVALVRPETVPPKRARPLAGDAEKLVLGLLQDASREAAPPLKLARSLQPTKAHPEISAGYEALRRGDVAAARRSYQAALASDPNGIDALLGLATVEARSGDRATATRHYRKTLALDAGNPTALGGLAALADFSRPEGLEASLRADIARYPRSAALQMTLGNLHASQGRWAEAQAAFFEAHRLEPQNADALYNLAVALDNLNQPRVAADFYRRALGLAKAAPAQFDARGAARRLAELKY